MTKGGRKSRFTLAAAVDHRDKASVQQAIIHLLRPVAQWVKTHPLDNGREFSGHQSIARQLDCAVYFARPYLSWERATNENGLLRQYLKKSLLCRRRWKKQSINSNHRPRKCLGFKTPAELFEQLSGKNYNLAGCTDGLNPALLSYRRTGGFGLS